MKRCKWASTEEIEKLNHIEVCPKAMDLTHTIAERISSDGGGALIIDYGLNGVVSDSLQVWYFATVFYASACFILETHMAKGLSMYLATVIHLTRQCFYALVSLASTC